MVNHSMTNWWVATYSMGTIELEHPFIYRAKHIHFYKCLKNKPRDVFTLAGICIIISFILLWIWAHFSYSCYITIIRKKYNMCVIEYLACH